MEEKKEVRILSSKLSQISEKPLAALKSAIRQLGI